MKKDKCVTFCTSSLYAMGVANVIIGIEKYSPGLIDNYIIFYNENDPLPKSDIEAFGKISNGKALFRQAMSTDALSEREKNRWSPMLLQKMRIFDLLKEYKSALYLEADMLIQGDISGMFELSAFSAITHPTKLKHAIIGGMPKDIAEFVEDDSLAIGAGIVFVKEDLLDDRFDYAEEAFNFAKRFKGQNIGMVLDELCLSLVMAKHKFDFAPMPPKYQWIPTLTTLPPTWFGYDATEETQPALIHAIGINKFWNNRLLNLFYPEWNINNNLWRNYGGSQFPGTAKYDDILVKSRGASFKFLDRMIQDTLDDKNLRHDFQDVLSYALENNSWNKKLLTKKADIVCAYGLGECFTDRFKPLNYGEIFSINYCCDRNEERGRKFAEENNLNFVTFDKLLKLNKEKNVVVILFLGSPWSLQREFIAQGLYTITAQDCDFDELSALSVHEDCFKDHKRDILNVYDSLNDYDSKYHYKEVLANCIAPHLAENTYKDLSAKSQVNYFTADFMPDLKEGEVLCDCGAYNGVITDYFLLKTEITGNGSPGFVYAYEMDEDNYNVLCKNLKNMESKYDGFSSDKYKTFHAAVFDKPGGYITETEAKRPRLTAQF